MDEIIRQALGILRSMWKFRWPAIIVAWLVAGFSAWQTFRIPDQYEASARVYVDTDSILKPLMSGLTVQPNVEQQLAMLTRTLLSRPNLERLIRMADLDLNVKSQEQRDALVDSLARSIRIMNSGRDNLYTLAYRDQDQEKAKRVIQSFVSMFVESSLGNTRKDTDSAKNFLSEQIRIYEAKLEEAEAKVKAFRLRNLELQSLEGGDAAGRVRAAQLALQQAQLELREAENARNAAKAQLDAERSQSQSAGTLLSRSLMQESSINIATPEIDARLEAQRRALDALIQRFTDQHPDVIITRRTIKELEEQKAVQMAALRQAAMSMPQSGGQGAGNPVIQEMQRILASTEVQVAQLRARVSEFSGRVAAAREGLKTAPELEAEQAQLNRDYGIIRRTYDELVSRRQQAIMSGELDSAAGVAEFRLIDPPRVSPKPVAPNRFAMLPGALFVGFGAGLALAFVLSQLRPVFHDANDLRAKTGVPLLGVVSMRLDEAQTKRERRGLVGFASAVGGLLGAFGIGLAVVAAMS
jgi:polysaccharide chain length determinant protein (PEP-CTERM system associated)